MNTAEQRLKKKEYDRKRNAGLVDHRRYLRRSYVARNRDSVNAQARVWRANNPDRMRAARARGVNRMRAYAAAWTRRNPEKVKAYRNRWWRKRVARDPLFRLRVGVRNRLNLAIARNTKAGHTIELLGCSIAFLKAHLESQFRPGMTWENWGVGKGHWHIDHKKPCAAFDLSSPAQQKECCHWTNLQPLWQEENISKKDK